MKQTSLITPVWRHWRKAFFAFRYTAIATIVAYGVAVFIDAVWKPLLWRSIFDALTHQHNPLGFFGSIVALSAVALLFNRIGDYCIVHCESNIIKYLKDYAIMHLLRHSADFFLNTFSGSIVAKGKRFAGTSENVFDAFVFTIFRVIVILTGVLYVVCTTLPAIGIVLLLWTLCFGFLSWYLSQLRTPYDLRSADADSHTTGQMSDIIGSVHMIRSFTAEDREHQHFTQTTLDEHRHRFRAWIRGNQFNAIQAVLTLILEVTCMYMVIHQALLGTVTIGTVVLVQSYLGSVISYMWEFSKSVTRIRTAFADAHAMATILDQEPAILDSPEPKKLIGDATIVFDDVSFGYSLNEKPILEHFNLTLPRGKRYGIVGPSGSGKTTLVSLLPREFDLGEGQGSITIGGVDIRDVPQRELRQAISFVPQKPNFPHRKVKDIIAFGKPTASFEEILEASQKASCHEFITKNLAHGYDTFVGERGVMLSGGQAQRIAIAAAFLKNAPILVLDEPTSALDSETESSIQAVLREMQGKTMIVIAHRLSTVAQLDEIIVIDNGVVLERGSHTTLLSSRNGLYRSLWDRQYLIHS